MNDTIDAPPDPPPHDRPPPPRPPEVSTPPVIGGVCAVLADRLGVDALWIRIGFVLLAATSGVGLFAYLGLWLALVAGPDRASRGMQVAGGVVLLLAVFGFAPFAISLPYLLTGTIFSPGALMVILLLAGLAVALWQPRRPSAVASAPPTTPTPSSTVFPDSAPAVASPPVPERRRSALGAFTLGVALLVVAFGALIDQVSGGRLHPEQWLGAAAVVCGIGMLVGVVRGNARWLILPAVILAGVGFVGGHMARMQIPLADLAGDRWVSISAPANVPSDATEARVGFGRIVVRGEELLRHSDSALPVLVDARVAVGSVEVWVPEDTSVAIRSVGDTTVRTYGTPAERNGEVYRFGPAGAPELEIDVWVGIGRIEVHTVSYEEPWPDEEPPAADVVDMGSLSTVGDGIAMTADGWFVIGEGEAVIDDEDQLVIGESWADGDGVTGISTMWGEYRLLPRGLLVTPNSEVLDLHALRPDPADDSADDPAVDPPGDEPAPLDSGDDRGGEG